MNYIAHLVICMNIFMYTQVTYFFRYMLIELNEPSIIYNRRGFMWHSIIQFYKFLLREVGVADTWVAYVFRYRLIEFNEPSILQNRRGLMWHSIIRFYKFLALRFRLLPFNFMCMGACCQPNELVSMYAGGHTFPMPTDSPWLIDFTNKSIEVLIDNIWCQSLITPWSLIMQWGYLCR